MRLFTGIAVPPHVIANIDEFVSRLRPLARAKWSPPENLHITTRFIGEWPNARLEELKNSLGRIRTPGPISIDISGLGFYPSAKRPRVFFANVNAGPALFELAQRTDDALVSLGSPPENRAYSPHLTLARLGEGNPHTLLQEIERAGNPEFGSWQADRFGLYLSQPGPKGSVYTVLASWPVPKETMAA